MKEKIKKKDISQSDKKSSSPRFLDKFASLTRKGSNKCMSLQRKKETESEMCSRSTSEIKNVSCFEKLL